jgi:hypothetical protein
MTVEATVNTLRRVDRKCVLAPLGKRETIYIQINFKHRNHGMGWDRRERWDGIEC